MKNQTVGRREAEDLKKIVAKVLKGLGNPEPPLDLLQVRELLKLDVKFYSSTETSYLQETVSKIKIASKQLIKRPTLLLDAVRKADLSALWLPDQKRILIDADRHPAKHRWLEGHEMGHSLAPWHQRFLFGDNSETVNHACHDALEAEANYASGQILFLQDRFTQEANDLPASLATVRKLATSFNNTITSTLWRLVEESHTDKFLVGFISHLPGQVDVDFDPNYPFKYMIESPGFKKQFATASDVDIYRHIQKYCRIRDRGPLGISQLQLMDVNGDRHVFQFESFANTHQVLTLGVYLRPVTLIF